nr:hypothetical protein [uncultured Pseudomonas sp.]
MRVSKRTKQSLAEHAQFVKSHGTHAVFARLTGTIIISRFFRALRQYIKRTLGTINGYKYFWFTSEDGVYVAFTGSMHITTLIYQFLQRDHLGAERVEILRAGVNRVGFTRQLDDYVSCFKAVPHVVSYGGTYDKERAERRKGAAV